ncbi:MAG: sigma-70 family RNA polymerase sigma factor [Flavobacteriaceae bacterium]|nr:sigma-70 family RNA polymerase sigma factor [Flavobacteriaceae bacterium]
MFQTNLIEACKQNNRMAQMQLYNKYCDAMYTIAMRYVKYEEDAADIVQEAFISAFLKLDQYKETVSFGAWLKKIVINRSLDFLRKNKEKFERLEEEIPYVVENEEDWNIDVGITITQVKEAISGLKGNYQYILMLYLIEGYDHAEISEILGISEVNSRTRLLRGKQKLIEALKIYEHETRS